MVETPRLQAKHVCHSEAEPKNLNALTETLRGACPEILHFVQNDIRRAQGDSLGGGFERVGFQPTCIEPPGLEPGESQFCVKSPLDVSGSVGVAPGKLRGDEV